MGGSDQWGNITAGIELIRRIRASEGKVKDDAPADAFGLTHPLVSKADGTKFGKSEKGNLWLDPNRTHPNEFYQFFVQTADADVMTYLKFFTFLSHEKLDALAAEVKAKPEARAAQRALARELTVMVHGEDACTRAEQTASALFGGGAKGGMVALIKEMKGSPGAVRAEISKSIPDLQSTGVPKARLGKLTLVDLLVETKLSPSKGAARKDIEGGGIYLNDERVSDVNAAIGLDSLIQGHGLVLRKGKKTHHFVYFE
jgi:tyrosyl-tRNA synthetase